MTINLADLRAKYEAATKGPMKAQRSDHDFPGMTDVLNSYSRVVVAVFREDAEFYVAAHAAFPELLAMAAEHDRAVEAANAEKAVLAKRLEVAMRALTRIKVGTRDANQWSDAHRALTEIAEVKP